MPTLDFRANLTALLDDQKLTDDQLAHEVNGLCLRHFGTQMKDDMTELAGDVKDAAIKLVNRFHNKPVPAKADQPAETEPTDNQWGGGA